MRKKIVFILLLVFLLSSGSQANNYKRETKITSRDIEWVVMLYLNGDNVLSAAQGQILEEVRQVGSTSQVQFAVLIDQNQDDDTRLYYIIGNSLIQQTWETESNMDDAETIKDFVLQVKSDYPANHYELIISSNKGSAWQGICWDDHGDGIMITMPELLDALNEITNNGSDKLDIFGFETCMTGNLEVAYQIKTCVDIMMAYPECALIGDWPYSEAFDDLISDPTMTPVEFATITVGHFIPKYVPQYNMKTTMSAIDLSYLDDIGTAMDDLGSLFIAGIEEYQDEIETALLGARVYAESWDIDYYIDLYHFLYLLSINNPDIINAKNTIMSLMNVAVIEVSHLPDDDAFGLNFYFPRRKADYNSSLRYDELPSPYEETQFAIDTQWDEFLKTYLGIYDNLPPEKPDIDGPASGTPGVEYDYTIIATDPEGDDIYYWIEWFKGCPGIYWQGPYKSGEAVVFSYSWEKKGTYTISVKAKDTNEAESQTATFKVTMPRSRILASSKIILIGKISSLEKIPGGDFRFLPVKLLEISLIIGQGLNISILDETYGGYPCCGYINKENFSGIVTKRFIVGFWKIPV